VTFALLLALNAFAFGELLFFDSAQIACEVFGARRRGEDWSLPTLFAARLDLKTARILRAALRVGATTGCDVDL
jgi:hypothetical protein